jgi:hypothetical protein
VETIVNLRLWKMAPSYWLTVVAISAASLWTSGRERSGWLTVGAISVVGPWRKQAISPWYEAMTKVVALN